MIFILITIWYIVGFVSSVAYWIHFQKHLTGKKSLLQRDLIVSFFFGLGGLFVLFIAIMNYFEDLSGDKPLWEEK